MADRGLCSIPECDKLAWARGWCGMHYQRWKTHGDPLGLPKRSPICAIEGCGRPRRRRDWCGPHYERWCRHGDPLAGGTAMGARAEYFQTTVLPYKGDACLYWPFSCSSTGYAMMTWRGGKQRVSRIACETINGPPPTPNHDCAHSCGNGHLGCVTPRHLSWKTRAENMADTLIHGTRMRGENHTSAKLTEAEIHQIRALHKRDTATNIAKRFGVAMSTVSAIHQRRIWAWLP